MKKTTLTLGIMKLIGNNILNLENVKINSAIELGDNYVQQGDFQKIVNKNYKLAILNDWRTSRYDLEVDSANRHLFGFQYFRPNQREIINACMENRDTFVCMPTGIIKY